MTHEAENNNPGALSMRGRLGFLAKDSILYGGATVLSRLFGLISFPVFARHFSVSDYGTLDFFIVLGSLMATFLVFGQDSAVARYYYEYESAEKRKQIVSQSLALQMSCALIALPLLWTMTAPIAGILSPGPEAATLFKLVLLQMPFLILVNFSQNILKWTFCRTRFLIISIGSAFISIVAFLVAVFWFDVGMVGVFATGVAVQSAFGVLGLVFCRQWLARPEGFGFLRELLPYAIPYGIICTISAFVPAMERTFISRLLGNHELGLYAAGARVAVLISLPIQAFQTAWGPFFLAIYKRPDAAATYNWVLKVYALGICVMVLGVSLAAGPAIHILASARYVGAMLVVFPMAMGLAIQSIGWIPGIGIGLSKKTYLTLYCYLVFLSVSGVGIWMLGHSLGFVGVAYGTLLGFVCGAILEIYLGSRAYPLAWSFSGVIAVPVATLVCGVVSQRLLLTGDGAFSVVALGVGIVVIPLLGWFLLFTKDERWRIMAFAAAQWNRRRL